MRFALASWTLLRRETVRFLRQRNRIVGAVGTPLVFWLLIGSGLHGSFRIPGLGDTPYLQYFYPGTIVLMVLFTAIFSTISVIEDRKEGFLQGVLAAPVPRGALATGKLLGGTALATFQGALFVAAAPLLGLPVTAASAAFSIGVLFLLSFGLTGLGFLLAWRTDSTQGFHAVMNLFLMPLWLLSGALFPAAGAPGWLQAVMRINPLTYGVAALQSGLGLAGDAPGSPVIGVAVTAGFAALMLVLSVRATLRRTERGVQ